MRKTIIGVFLVCMIAISVAGITGGLISIEPISKDKVMPDAQFEEVKTVLEKGGVEVKDLLDVAWKEVSCDGSVCVYALYKKNLFNGDLIKVDYKEIVDLDDRVDVLNSAIEKRIFEVSDNWAIDQDKNVLDKQVGEIIIKSDKAVVKDPVK